MWLWNRVQIKLPFLLGDWDGCSYPLFIVLITQLKASLWKENFHLTNQHSWKWANCCVHKVLCILWSEHRFPPVTQCIAKAAPTFKEFKSVAGFFLYNQERENYLDFFFSFVCVTCIAKSFEKVGFSACICIIPKFPFKSRSGNRKCPVQELPDLHCPTLKIQKENWQDVGIQRSN